MADVTRLPGSGCRHHTAGRCLYEENLNPGYTERFRCGVLLRWEAAFDDFLSRAEALGVSQEAVPDLWERKFERMARQVFECGHYALSHSPELPMCVHAVDGLCLLALPPCRGRCRHYDAVNKNPMIP